MYTALIYAMLLGGTVGSCTPQFTSSPPPVEGLGRPPPPGWLEYCTTAPDNPWCSDAPTLPN